jgi:hypothetical protein
MSRPDRGSGNMAETIGDRFRGSAPDRIMASRFHAIEGLTADRVRVSTESREPHGRHRN